MILQVNVRHNQLLLSIRVFTRDIITAIFMRNLLQLSLLNDSTPLEIVINITNSHHSLDETKTLYSITGISHSVSYLPIRMTCYPAVIIISMELYSFKKYNQ